MRHTQYALSSPKKGLHILGLDKFTKNILHFLHKKTHYCLNNSGSSFVFPSTGGVSVGRGGQAKGLGGSSWIRLAVLSEAEVRSTN